MTHEEMDKARGYAWGENIAQAFCVSPMYGADVARAMLAVFDHYTPSVEVDGKRMVEAHAAIRKGLALLVEEAEDEG